MARYATRHAPHDDAPTISPHLIQRQRPHATVARSHAPTAPHIAPAPLRSAHAPRIATRRDRTMPPRYATRTALMPHAAVARQGRLGLPCAGKCAPTLAGAEQWRFLYPQLPGNCGYRKRWWPVDFAHAQRGKIRRPRRAAAEHVTPHHGHRAVRAGTCVRLRRSCVRSTCAIPYRPSVLWGRLSGLPVVCRRCGAGALLRADHDCAQARIPLHLRPQRLAQKP